MMNTHKRKNKQYRTVKRNNRYVCRLVERSFCLDVNFLSRKGFFKTGRGPKWTYMSSNKKDHCLGEIYICLVDSMYPDEDAIMIDNGPYYDKQTIRVIYQAHPLVHGRYWFKCSKCNKRTATIFIPLGEFVWACRKCHKLVYWSQMRGSRRVGREEYAKHKELYRVHKRMVMDASAIE